MNVHASIYYFPVHVVYVHVHMYPCSCPGRKSNCVREVEKLKKNREERRARQAEQMAQRREVGQ